MEQGSAIIGFFRRFFRILVSIVGIGVILPVIIAVIAGFPAGIALSFILSAFALQAAVPPVGVALGLPVWLILVILTCFAAGVVLGIYEVCITLGASSKRVSSFIGKVEQKTAKYPIIRKYGPITCILIAWIPGIGLYGTPVIAWMLGWKRIPSVICTAAGFLIASLFVLFFASRINELLHLAAIAGVIVYAVTVSLSMGLSLPVSLIRGSLQKPILLLSLLIVNFILVPIAASLIVSYLFLPSGASTGLVLLSLSAGAPSLYSWLRHQGGDGALLAPHLAILCLVSIIFIPLMLPFLFPVGWDYLWMAFFYLGILVLVPLLAALYFSPRHEAAASRWSPVIDKVSWIALGVTVITMLILFTTAFFEVPGTISLIAAVLFVLVGYLAGYAAGGRDPGVRRIFAMVTAPRNLADALIVAFLVFREGPVMVMALVAGLIGLVPFMINWWSMRKHRTSLPKLL
ncbi:MAG TPA: hypothetical protein PK154_01655 [Methanoregulaceae archaeon]|nr:hypothetical protein [Methanoregulaceae archaeon]